MGDALSVPLYSLLEKQIAPPSRNFHHVGPLEKLLGGGGGGGGG